MLVYLTKPLKGYAHREGDVISIPNDLATRVINEGGALPYTEDKKEVEKVKEVKREEPIKPTQNVAHKGSKKMRK